MKRFFILLALCFGAARADLIDDGMAAVDNGDYKKAVEIFKRACNSNDMFGCRMLGVMYDNGDGVIQDYAKAAELYKKACDGGVAEGCVNLGLMYTNGEGVPRNLKEAKEFFGKACDYGDQQGCEAYKNLNR